MVHFCILALEAFNSPCILFLWMPRPPMFLQIFPNTSHWNASAFCIHVSILRYNPLLLHQITSAPLSQPNVKYTYLIYFCSEEFVIFVFHSSHFFNHCIWQHYSASFSLPPTKRLYLLPFYLRKFYYIVSCVHQNAQYFVSFCFICCHYLPIC